MCQVVAYWRLKTIENSKTFRKSGRGRFREVVVYESFPFKAFDWGHFWCFEKVVAYRRWSTTGGGRTWTFDRTYELFHIIHLWSETVKCIIGNRIGNLERHAFCPGIWRTQLASFNAWTIFLLFLHFVIQTNTATEQNA